MSSSFTHRGTGGDYNLDVLRGLVPGHSMVSINGFNDAASTTIGTIGPGMVAGYEIDQGTIDGTPAAVIVGSTSAADNGSTATGALTARVIGLNSSGVAATEDVTLDGQTGVTTSATWSAINGLRVLTWGSGKTNAGNLWVGTGALSVGIPAVRIFSALAGHSKGLTAYYVVPAGKTLYLRRFNTTLAQATKAIDISVEVSTDSGINFITEALFGIESGGPFVGKVIGTPGIAAGSHIRIRGLMEASTAIVTAILACELIDN